MRPRDIYQGREEAGEHKNFFDLFLFQSYTWSSSFVTRSAREEVVMLCENRKERLEPRG